jgi:NAD(P)-dependent dehydrogenase (short-subunit alcohol dehydrogenase family)
MAFTTGPGRSVYCATKAALEAISKNIAAELAPKGIRSNTLCPTFIETPLGKEMLAKPGSRRWCSARSSSAASARSRI